MSNLRDPLVDRYLARFRDGLRGAKSEEREEYAREIESHIAEAVASGEQATTVLERLGPADRLAKAYRLELTLSSRGRNLIWRMFAVLGLVVTASIPSMIIIPLLFGLGLGFVVGGGVAVLIAVLPFANADFYNISNDAVNRLLGLLTGLGLLTSGLIAFWALYLYVLLLVRAMRGALRIGG